MKIVSNSSTFAAQVASFAEGRHPEDLEAGCGVFRFFRFADLAHHNFFDVHFSLVRNASTVESIEKMDELGCANIRVWYDGVVDFVDPPLIFSHTYHEHRMLSWFLVSIGMSLKNPRTQSSSPIAAREKKRWGTAMKVLRSAAPVPGNLCIPPEEWEVLRILDENPLLYRDAEFKEWAMSRSDQSV